MRLAKPANQAIALHPREPIQSRGSRRKSPEDLAQIDGLNRGCSGRSRGQGEEKEAKIFAQRLRNHLGKPKFWLELVAILGLRRYTWQTQKTEASSQSQGLLRLDSLRFACSPGAIGGEVEDAGLFDFGQ
jgi:hypothetical protein